MLLKLLSRILLFFLFFLFAMASRAQLPFPSPASNLRIKQLPTGRDSLLLDTLSIVPSSFSIKDYDTSFYGIDYVRSVLYWKHKPPADSILAPASAASERPAVTAQREPIVWTVDVGRCVGTICWEEAESRLMAAFPESEASLWSWLRHHTLKG